jgi:hypothetical protein
MKQSRRILVFVMALLFIGVPSVYFLFFTSGNTCWMPNCRVLLRIESTFQGTEFAYCMMDCYNFTEKEYRAMLVDGDVEFDESVGQGEEKEYLIVTKDADGAELRMLFTAQGEFAHLVEINGDKGTEKCDCLKTPD